MSEYLLPNDEISIDEQRNISEIRNTKSDEKEDMEHIHNFRYYTLLSFGSLIFDNVLKIGNFEGTFAT